jgi:hypothetical protein
VCVALTPGVVFAITPVGLEPPVRPVEPVTIVGTGRFASAPWNVIVTAVGSGPPAVTTLPVPMFGSASSAVCTAAALALNATVVGRPSNVIGTVPPVGVPVVVSVWTALVPDGVTVSAPWKSHSSHASWSVPASNAGCPCARSEFR